MRITDDNEEIIKKVIEYQTDTLEELMNKARVSERIDIIILVESQLAQGINKENGELDESLTLQNRTTCLLILSEIKKLI